MNRAGGAHHHRQDARAFFRLAGWRTVWKAPATMGQRAKVVVTDFISEPLDHERRILGGQVEVVALNAFSEDDLEGKIEDAEAVMVYHFVSLTARTIQRLRKCKLIVRCGVGFDNIDAQSARQQGITVANIPDYGTEDVADSAIGMMLALTRGVHYFNSRLQDGKGPWTYTQAQPLHRLRGRVFGVVGIGRIGTATALRARALGMDVVFYDPFVPQGRDRSLGIRSVEVLDELLGQAFVISLHCPLTAETKHLINRGTIAKMPRGSYVVNTARGGVVDVLAVLDAITSGHLTGAAIDVLETEPPPDDHPLIQAWRDPDHPAHGRIILNPHAAFYSEEGLLDIRIKASENCRRALVGQKPFNIVN
jgi:D-3-phosphoglycerate dehydrogenase/C-terminal binding protein